jgi:hypothetical protein
VLSDDALPEEFKLALAESLQHGIFSSVRLQFKLEVNLIYYRTNIGLGGGAWGLQMHVCAFVVSDAHLAPDSIPSQSG